MDHMTWLQLLYEHYNQKRIPVHVDSFMNEELDLNETIYNRCARQPSFEDIWLEKFPPLLKKQDRFMKYQHDINV